MIMMETAILIVLVWFTDSQSFSISINYPFLITNQSEISYMQADLTGNFFIQFGNGTVQKYNPTLTSSQIISYPQIIEFMHNENDSLIVYLQGGSMLFTAGLYQSVIYNNWTCINFHDYNTYAVLSSYNLNDTIVKSFGMAFYNPSTIATPHNIVICKTTLKFIYQSQIYTIYSFNTTFGTNVTATSAQYAGVNSGGTGSGYQNISYVFYISTNMNKTYTFNVTLSFLYNQTTLIFNFLSFTSSFSQLTATSQTIGTMLYNTWANVIIMQSIQSHLYYFFCPAASTFGTGSPNLTSYIMHQVLNVNNLLYILSNKGLIHISAPSSTTSLILMAVVNLLPANNYELVFGKSNLLYIIKGPNVYFAGPCLGQTLLNNNTCVSYGCNVSNCNYCPINSVTCGVCNNGTTRNSSFLCSSNTTFQANSTTTNPTNSTNQNNSTNPTNSTNAINQTSPTYSSNLTSQDYNNFYLNFISKDILSILRALLNILLIFLQTLIEIPGARSIFSPIFYLFGSFDNLFLYQYHDRTYNSILNDFFSQINHLETYKWDFINSTYLISQVGNFEGFYNFTNFQSTYQQFNYTQNTLNARQSEGLFYNTQNYFVAILPITFGYFYIFHLSFSLLFNYAVSKIFRCYQFWIFLLLIQLEGNVQQLTFYLSRQWISIFFLSFPHKVLKVSIIFYGFILIFSSCSVYYLFRWFNKTKIRVVMDNYKITGLSIFYITFQFGLKSMYFGAANFFGRFLSYSTFIQILLASEIVTTLFPILLFRCKFFKNVTKVWLGIILSLIRIMFIICLLLDYQNVNSSIQEVQFILILLMIGIFSIGMVIGLIINAKQYGSFFYQNCCQSRLQDSIPEEIQQLRTDTHQQIKPNYTMRKDIKIHAYKTIEQTKENNIQSTKIIKEAQVHLNNIHRNIDAYNTENHIVLAKFSVKNNKEIILYSRKNKQNRQ